MPATEPGIELQMSLLLFAALSGYLLAARIQQSAVVGAILVGIVIGPAGLGWITYTTFVGNLAHLGAVILLFVVGLEFKLRDIAEWRYFWIALGGVIVPWLAGWSLALVFGFPDKAAILIGTALTATSIAITANVLKEMGQLRTPVARAIIGAAVMDDVLSLMALSLTESLVDGDISWPAIALLSIKVLLFLAVGGILGQRLFTPFVTRMDDSRLSLAYPEFIFVLALAIAFLYALLAELIGLSAIVGAFLAGVALEGVELRHSRNFREGAEYLRIVFAAIFFISLGVLADVRQLTWETTAFLLALTLVALLSKWLGCGLVARLFGESRANAMSIGIGMAPRGEVAMIVALLGLQQGLIGQPTYLSLVFMSLLTTLVTPPMLRSAMKSDKTSLASPD